MSTNTATTVKAAMSEPVAAPKPVAPKPVQAPKAKAKKVEDVDPASTMANATKTLIKWGFASQDVDEALKKTSAKVGETATGKMRQVAALDWLLVNCDVTRVPAEYKQEAMQARA